MEISQNCVVALTWVLKDTLGEELDVLDEPVEFLMGGKDLLPAIEEALQGHGVGASLHLQIEPEQAFGDFAPKDALFTVTDIYPEHVVLDANHPLAGIAIRISLKVEGVREATEEEMERGSTGTGFFKIEPLHNTLPGDETLH